MGAPSRPKARSCHRPSCTRHRDQILRRLPRTPAQGGFPDRSMPQPGSATPVPRSLEPHATPADRPVMARDRMVLQLPSEALERRAGIGDDAERDRTRHADVSWFNVDLNDFATRWFTPVFVERHVEVAKREPTTSMTSPCGGVRPPTGFARGSTADDRARLRCARRPMDYRATESLRERNQCRTCPRPFYAGASKNDRDVCSREHLGRRVELCLGCLRRTGATGLVRKIGALAGSTCAYSTGAACRGGQGPAGRPASRGMQREPAPECVPTRTRARSTSPPA